MTKQIKENFPKLLRSHSLKATPQRLEIMAILNRAAQPLTVNRIIKQLTVPANQATVYRTLTALKKAGLVNQIGFQHSHAHYALNHSSERHHVICTNCSKVATITKCEAPAIASTALEQSDFAAINNHTLQFYGLCKKCISVI
jgi:Fe2+ or Zn2+ uptake regulation protein